MRKFILGFFIVISLVSTTVYAANSYKIDPVHSSLSFYVNHMMISNVVGQFDQFDGQIIFDEKDPDNSKINITVQSSSINTRNEKRDTHLKSPDFFDIAQFPTMSFVSKEITETDITGDLTIKGVTKEVTIPVTVSGPVKGMMGTNVIGFNGNFTLNRLDYGLNWNKTLDQGGLLVGNEVTVLIAISADEVEVPKQVVNEVEKK